MLKNEINGCDKSSIGFWFSAPLPTTKKLLKAPLLHAGAAAFSFASVCFEINCQFVDYKTEEMIFLSI
jgi:hypothetical protein